MRSTNARALLQSVRDLSADPAFWKDRSEGLAAFVSVDGFHRFRLPRRFEDLAAVDSRFHIKPLLPLVGGGQRFYALALSQNDVRLFEVAQAQIRQVEVAALPRNMSDALNYTSIDRGSQVHPAATGSGGLGKQAVVFHGQGGEPDTHKDDLVQFLRQVDAALDPVLTAAPAPLLVAGVGYVLQIYRDICSYPELAERQLEGNCDYLTPSQIRERALPLMASVLQRDREKAAQRYRQLAGTRQTSDDIAQVLIAAKDGKVDVLFVDARAQVWGTVGHDHRTVEVHDTRRVADDDLLDLAVAETFLHRGKVYGVEPESLPGGRFVAALFRY
jgi:putative intracellular protease/amidase